MILLNQHQGTKHALARELRCRLSPSCTHDNRVVEIVVGQVSRPAHGAVEPETSLSARRRCTTGLGFCAEPSRNCSQSCSCRVSY